MGGIGEDGRRYRMVEKMVGGIGEDGGRFRRRWWEEMVGGDVVRRWWEK